MVIAHRGASGYLPENTLASFAAAHAMGADFIEMDVTLTADDQLVVLHDLFLETLTDVADRFPVRRRDDGHFYAIDFRFDEIASLRVHERADPDGNAVFPDRFPVSSGIFRVPALGEAIELIRGMNRSRGCDVGLYIEPKAPAWHAGEGRDIVARLLRALAGYGYRSKGDRVIVQSFDAASLKRARTELNCELTLVQLTGDNAWAESDTDFEALLTGSGLAEVSGYADGIGPWLPQVVDVDQDAGEPEPTGLVERAHELGLFVHAYTLRREHAPPPTGGFDRFLEFLIRQVSLDGVFTDFPDRANAVRNQTRPETAISGLRSNEPSEP
jgi:glycerophosphoryl diester phosphodiesterase